ncbi:hypothetical protein CMQ_5837 [Grosmannia clavigera kw1407]|uniref:Pru domain-containing protein n=1 Tax=Grosmannia clavigera (strain kw1407 / UAMH 11150) TaxID=655863 RepID=F0XIF3_GROCL|nr:uncharacterized protein CMQ_5837 [Grosmannia clavigera kw1407]EFX02476.1 hypothetical protein CMQ_5837 [Grosmannia clavigera kw1407]
MSIVPIITFKAGLCEVDTSTRPQKVKALVEPGYIYLYSEEDLIRFCWRPRNVPIDVPTLNLVMVPTDGHFVPYDGAASGHASAKTNGRIFVLKFESSSQRYLFWLQSKPQAASGDPSWMSPRDRKIGDIVDRLLQGEELDVNHELAQVKNNTDDSRRDGDDDDETMEDVEGHGGSNLPQSSSGGPGATGGDARSEGEDSREGGADGARAASSAAPADAAAMVRNLLASLSGQQGIPSQERREKLYPLLNDLLEPSVTIPMIKSASEEYIDGLLSFLPPTVLILSQQDAIEDGDIVEPTAEAAAAAKVAMSIAEKKGLLEKVLRTPQFHQSLASLTMAIRDGGLPSIADALAIPVKNHGFLPGGAMPLGGGEAVEAFVEGVKSTVQEKLEKQKQ